MAVRSKQEKVRTEIARHVHRRLADREFASRLVANAQTGEAPILVALLEDPLVQVVAQTGRLGGVANLFVGVPAGVICISLEVITAEKARQRAAQDGIEIAEIHSDCTVGIFVALLQVWNDRPRFIHFVDGNPTGTEGGRAQVVAFA